MSAGTRSQPILREIATRLASVGGEAPDVIDGAGHLIHCEPEAAAAYIRSHVGAD